MVDDIRPQPGPAQTNNNNPANNPPPPTVPPPDKDDPVEIPPINDHEEGFILTKDKPRRFWRWEWPHIWWRKASTKERIIGSTIILILLFLGGAGVYTLNKHFSKSPTPPTPVVQKKAPEPPKTTEASRLTGVEIPVALNKRPVTSVQIENSPDARPQAGLSGAGIVFEAIAEGGITRFNAMFMEGQPDYIGPVRSIRPYYIDFFLPFDASLVHAGGSPEGLAKLRQLGVKDLDHGNTGGAFRRVSDRFAPHNLYTSMAELDKASQSKGFTSSTFKSWPRKKDAPSAAPTARSIALKLSSPLYDVHYAYDKAGNGYKRSLGGRPHIEHKTGQQLLPKVVVALVMGWSQNGIYSVYQTTGSGEMFVFQDGIVQKGTWKKAGPKDQFQFIGPDGKPLAFNAGQTWVSIIRGAGDASYTP